MGGYGNTMRTRLAAEQQQTTTREAGRRRARSTDPETSQDAAMAFDAESLVARCHTLLLEAGTLGMTSSEMAGAIGLSRDSISPRLPALREIHGVMDSGQKRNRQTVWIAGSSVRRTIPPKVEKTREKGAVKLRGEVYGAVEKATLVVTKKDIKHDLFLGDCDNVADAMRSGRGSWCFDLGLMEALYAKGVHFVEVPTHQGPRFRAKLETLLGPLGFDRVAGDRPLVCLNLKHWTRIDPV
jgi:hypothetical protein